MKLFRFSLIGLISLLISPIIYAFDVACAAVARAVEIAFPVEATRIQREAPQFADVTYAARKARTRSFLARLHQRIGDQPAYGAVGLCPIG